LWRKPAPRAGQSAQSGSAYCVGWKAEGLGIGIRVGAESVRAGGTRWSRGVWTPLKGRYDVRPFRPTSRAPQADFFLATGAPTQTSQFVSIFPFFQVELFAFINARVCWQHGRFGGQPSSTDFCCAIPEPVAAPVVMTVLGFSCVLTRVHRGAPPRPVRHVWELDQHRSA